MTVGNVVGDRAEQRQAHARVFVDRARRLCARRFHRRRRAADAEQRNAAISAVIFYLLTYAVMNLGAFAVVQLIARAGDRRTEVEDYNGIGFQSPWLAFCLSLFLLSLLGMPLTAGFIGKVMVFRAALDQGYYVLVVIGVLNTAISAYYYLRLIIVMFFRERTTAWNAPRIPASIARRAGYHHSRSALPWPVSRPRHQCSANKTIRVRLAEISVSGNANR